MNREDKLREKFGTDPGFRVPENFFEDFYKEMGESLPPLEAAPRQPDLSLWQRMKPYVYLAAMFMGIWLTMKVFHTVSSNQSLSLDNPPEQIAQLIRNDSDLDFSDQHIVSVSDYDVENEVIDSYGSFEDFQEDLGIELEPRYENIDIEKITSE